MSSNLGEKYVKAAMSSSSTTSRNRGAVYGIPVRRTWETSNRRCRCGEMARIWTSSTNRNPGRRFESCPNFQDPRRDCNYFRWIDTENASEPYSSRVYEMHLENRREEDDVIQMLNKTRMDLMLLQKCFAVMFFMLIITLVIIICKL